ncbi:MAG: hypothetical protein P4L91_06455 [Burkholderiaceae bacterium]|nr:hypothetical protein [Burkholderiaceae bacterium]
MNEGYSDLTGEYTHPTKGVVTHGAASMTTQVFGEGGLKKKLNEAHLNGYKEGLEEGIEEGYQRGFEDGLKAKVFALVAQALAQKNIVDPEKTAN